jgi:hypothetical protein
VDVAVETLPAQQLNRSHQTFQGVIRTPHNAGAQKEAFDVIPAVEVDRQRHYFSGCKCRSGYIVAASVYTVGTIIDAEIGIKDF